MADPQRKRKTAPLPAEHLSDWTSLIAQLVSVQRPTGSITATELSSKAGISLAYAGKILADEERQSKAKGIWYRTEQGYRAKCYIRT